MQTLTEVTPFQNEPFTDFSEEENAAAMQKALQEVEASFPQVVRLWIDGKDCEGGGGTLDSIDPGRNCRGERRYKSIKNLRSLTRNC